MYWDHDVGWGGWLVMTVGMVGFWAAVALVVVLVARAVRTPAEPSAEVPLDPRQILERRLARGEIGVDEFRVRLEAIEGSSGPDRRATTPPAEPGARPGP